MLPYLLGLATVAALYTTLAAGLAIGAVRAGTVSLMSGALYGIGAYVAALSATRMHLGLAAELGTAVLIGATTASVVGAVIIRGSREDAVLGTLAAQAVMVSLAVNIESLTNGAQGIGGIPPITVASTSGATVEWGGALSALLLAALTVWGAARLGASELGRLMTAVAEDEEFAQSLGRNTRLAKVAGLAGSGACAAAAGVLYAHYATYVSPSSFGIGESILVLSIVVLGGSERVWAQGAVAVAVIVIPELLRGVGMPLAYEANVRDLLWGAVLVLAAMRGGRTWKLFGNSRTEVRIREGLAMPKR